MKILTFLATIVLVCHINKQTLAQSANWEKVSANSFVTSVETTPWGVVTGEYDTRAWLNPFNGIYISKDLGATWQQSGLNGRGVTEIKYFDGKIYAVTYYWKDNTVGLFVSGDKGKTWSHLGNNFSTTSVSKDPTTLYVGGSSHGLWISKDEGVTWVQKIGEGWFGPKITTIESSENITIVATQNTSYKSLDHGETWQEIPDFVSQSIKYINIRGNIILAGSSGTTGGMFRSTDLGNTWEKLNGFGSYASGDITNIENIYYAGRIDSTGSNMTILKSTDNGTTWEDTFLSIPAQYGKTLGVTSLFSQPSYLFTAQSSFGIYRYKIPQELNAFPFLRTPWNNTNSSEFIDKIYSFFDHTYPLLGYGYYQEPAQEQNTTLNFLGEWGYMPDLYYSSHDGYDFSLAYGTEILAPSSGFASYFYCNACGNAIKIDHLNGYQTTYFHFQGNGLITKSQEPVWVEEGQIIGKVGMTGNTTGPHLHFSIVKDTDNDGSFTDESPNGKVDPFSWKNRFYADPWEQFEWTDTLGTHKGTKSLYLWKIPYPSSVGYMPSQNQQILVDNKTLEIKLQPSEEGLTVEMKPHTTPIIPNTQNLLGYVTNTSLVIEAFDHFTNKITALETPFNLRINYTLQDIQNISVETMKLYAWNNVQNIWEPLPTIINLAEKYLTAEIPHLSYFAVLGEKIQTTKPITTIEISGDIANGWYKSYPTVTLNSQNQIFFSLGNTELWSEYTEPFETTTEGTTTIYYRAMDLYGNIEEVQTSIIKVDTSNSWKKTIKVMGSTFNFQ